MINNTFIEKCFIYFITRFFYIRKNIYTSFDKIVFHDEVLQFNCFDNFLRCHYCSVLMLVEMIICM